MEVSEETKKKISKKMKEVWKERSKTYYKENKHFISKPCENFKDIMTKEGYSFVEEYQPLYPNRFFAIDIAIPDKKIGIEINGTQHYENGKLKKYYQDRHDLICEKGWILHEIPYNLAWNRDFVLEFLKDIEKNKDTDYSDFIRKPKEYKCIVCGCDIDPGNKSKKCHKCFHKERRKVERPSYEQLLKDKETLPMTRIGKKYGVTDNAVRKWLNNYEKELK